MFPKRRAIQKKDDDWTNPVPVTFKVDQLDFLLPVKPVSNSIKLPLGLKGQSHLIVQKNP